MKRCYLIPLDQVIQTFVIESLLSGPTRLSIAWSRLDHDVEVPSLQPVQLPLSVPDLVGSGTSAVTEIPGDPLLPSIVRNAVKSDVAELA